MPSFSIPQVSQISVNQGMARAAGTDLEMEARLIRDGIAATCRAYGDCRVTAKKMPDRRCKYGKELFDKIVELRETNHQIRY